MAHYGLLGKMTTETHDRDALIHILSQAADLMQTAAGCRLYVVSRDADDNGLTWVMELWDSQAAHDESLALPGVRDLINQAMPLLKGTPKGVKLEPVAGMGS